MQYQGGKSRIAVFSSSAFVSLFCGSCAVESKVQGFDRVILNDKQPYLIALLQAVQEGWDPPNQLSEAEYRFIKDNKDLSPRLAGFAGFGCSFGGKWFGGYARNKGGTNYAAQSRKSLLKDMATLLGAEIRCGDYRECPIPAGATVYADPPYKGTTGYNKETFDSDTFWRAMQLLVDTGHEVFVSEMEAPDGWKVAWEKPFTRTLDRNKNNQFVVTEKLFYGTRVIREGTDTDGS